MVILFLSVVLFRFNTKSTCRFPVEPDQWLMLHINQLRYLSITAMIMKWTKEHCNCCDYLNNDLLMIMISCRSKSCRVAQIHHNKKNKASCDKWYKRKTKLAVTGDNISCRDPSRDRSTITSVVELTVLNWHTVHILAGTLSPTPSSNLSRREYKAGRNTSRQGERV